MNGLLEATSDSALPFSVAVALNTTDFVKSERVNVTLNVPSPLSVVAMPAPPATDAVTVP